MIEDHPTVIYVNQGLKSRTFSVLTVAVATALGAQVHPDLLLLPAVPSGHRPETRWEDEPPSIRFMSNRAIVLYVPFPTLSHLHTHVWVSFV
jgi:hypothetical protein